MVRFASLLLLLPTFTQTADAVGRPTFGGNAVTPWFAASLAATQGRPLLDYGLIANDWMWIILGNDENFTAYTLKAAPCVMHLCFSAYQIHSRVQVSATYELELDELYGVSVETSLGLTRRIGIGHPESNWYGIAETRDEGSMYCETLDDDGGRIYHGYARAKSTNLGGWVVALDHTFEVDSDGWSVPEVVAGTSVPVTLQALAALDADGHNPSNDHHLDSLIPRIDGVLYNGMMDRWNALDVTAACSDLEDPEDIDDDEGETQGP